MINENKKRNDFKCYLFPFSAKSQEQLNQKLNDMLIWFEEENFQMEDLSFTLTVGRSHFAERIAFVAETKTELEQKIKNFFEESGRTQKDRIEKGRIGQLQKQVDNIVEHITEVSSEQEYKSSLQEIATFYSNGVKVSWSDLFKGKEPHKIPIPTYPFKANKYWFDCDYKNVKKEASVLGKVLDENCSTMEEIVFRKIFTKEEFFIKDHIVENVFILPGVVHLEMAVQALKQAAPSLSVESIQKVSWLAPIKLEKEDREKEVEIHLYHGDTEKEFYFEIVSQEAGHEVLHSEGIVYGSSEVVQKTEILPVNDLVKGGKKIKASSVYHNFEEHKLCLKKSFQAIMELLVKENEAVGFLELPLHLRKEFSEYKLHPSILDGALEAVISLVTVEAGQDGAAALPFCFEKMEIYGDIPMNGITYVHKTENPQCTDGNVFDVCLAEEDGTVKVRFYGFTLKEFYQKKQSEEELLCYTSQWEATDTLETVCAGKYEDGALHTMVLIDGSEILKTNLKKRTNRTIYQLTYDNDTDKLKEQLKQIGKVDEVIFQYSGTVEQPEEVWNEFKKQLAVIQQLTDATHQQIRVINLMVGDRMPGVFSADKALYKTAMLEQNEVTCSCVYVDKCYEKQLDTIVLHELECQNVEVAYFKSNSQCRRYIHTMVPVKEKQVAIPFHKGGTYLITGGMGKLGLLMASYLSRKYEAKLVLTGRRKQNSAVNQELAKLEALGGKVVYVQADVTKKEDMVSAVKMVQREFGQIQGVIHCAGIAIDSYLNRKQVEDACKVIIPKVTGLTYLDELTKGEPLEVFLAFSSIAAVIGNFGQGDYAYANAYMDSFMEYRESLRAEGKRNGISISIDWSFWKDGGIGLDKETLQFSKTTIGITPISNDEGIILLETALKSGAVHVLAAKGEHKKLEAVWSNQNKVKSSHTSTSDMNSDIVKKAEDGMIDIISQMMGIQKSEILLDEDIEVYGFNSLTFTDLTNTINNRYHLKTTPALFFQYPTIGEFTEYLAKEYGDITEGEQQEEKSEDSVLESQSIQPIAAGRLKDRRKGKVKKTEYEDSIAIVGISGVFADSETMDEFWDNLVEQKDLTSVIPKKRWDYEELDRKEKAFSGKTVSRYGSFINDFDCFDRELFCINPREANLMDPQQRIFLQTVWAVMEDAGYKASDMAGSRTGLFVGVATNDYSQLLQEYGVPVEAYSSTGISHCVLANRISYLFNFHGPSEPVDTACSSSLIAIHRAVESIRNGECEQAIAGGVNLMMSPTLHISFSRAGMLAKDGKCKTFDKRADGYVRGEGAGAILLKPLSKALEDRDHIYALVKGTAVNHGGKVSSLTVPNPKAQIDVLTRAYQKAGFAPDSISYIEAHGTGTNLGDPIEINALKDAFSNMFEAKHQKMEKEEYCGLGTIKTNIGHLEAAAGIAGILKVLMSMRNKKIPGIVNFEEQNPYIALEHSPFYIVKNTKEWKTEKGSPRRAGVSSFGFGGANAHIALEEYVNVYAEESRDEKEYPFILSAQSMEQLTEKARALEAYIRKHDIDEAGHKELTLANISYTLCVGREDMEVRAAFSAFSKETMLQGLATVQKGCEDEIVTIRTLTNNKGREHGDSQQRNVKSLLDAWVQGEKVNWKQDFFAGTGNRISLPCYPFKKEICWFEKPKQVMEQVQSSLHPMVDSNQSTMEEERFRKVLHIEEMYLKDHVVGGKVLLPGVAYLEMVRAAAVHAGIQPVSGLKEIRWIQTLQMDSDTKEVFIGFFVSEGEIFYQVYSEHNGHRKVYSDGKVITDVILGASHIDLYKIQERCQNVLEKETCYNHIFKGVGFDYGPAFRVTEKAYCHLEEGLAELHLPEHLKHDFSKYVLHPSLLDGAVRSISWAGERSDEEDLVLRVPYAMDRIEILDSIPEICYAYARPCTYSAGTDSTGTKKYDIQIVNSYGDEVVRVYGFSIKQLVMEKEDKEVDFIRAVEEPVKIEETKTIQQNVSKYIILAASETDARAFRKSIAGKSTELKKEQIIAVFYGEEWRQNPDGSFNMNGTKESILRLLDAVSIQKGEFIKVIHGWNLPAVEPKTLENSYLTTYKEELKTGIYSMLALLQTFMNREVKVDVVFGFDNSNESTAPLFRMLSGFANTSKSVSSSMQIKLVGFCDSREEMKIPAMVEEVFHSFNDLEVIYRDGNRMIRNWSTDIIRTQKGFVKNGVYLVTGGTGAIGKKIARYLAKEYQASIVLTGRKELAGDTILQEIESLGGKGYFIRADVTKCEEVRQAVYMAQGLGDKLNGIIHCAGIGDVTPVQDATEQSFEKILLPKVQGAINLDLETISVDLDLFILFSSVSSQIGDMGSCSYSSANAYLDHFAQMRNELAEKKQRFGRTISINWPLWKDGRYQIQEEQERTLKQYYGLQVVDDEIGIKMLEQVAKMEGGTIFVCFGKPEQTKRMLIKKRSTNVQQLKNVTTNTVQVDNSICLEKVTGFIRDIFAKTIHIARNQVNTKAALDSFGIDSIMIMELNQNLAEVFPDLSKTIFYEYNTIEKLAEYLTESYRENILEYFHIDQAEKSIEEAFVEDIVPTPTHSFRNGILQKKMVQDAWGQRERNDEPMDIAVIGLDGKFPMARDIYELWENLKSGKDCITEIPVSRWDYREDYDEEKGKKGKIYTKYGGFIKDVDKFDPQFFQMTPRDAVLTDPQERLFLECAYHTIEDAGYTRDALSEEKTGVFVGVMYGHYQIIGTEANKNGGMTPPNSSFASIANRVSYIFNWKGPSIAMDTMCSSSLTALHMACESIRNGESDVALAGGVNVTIHKNKYIFLCSQRFASSEGKCRAFGEGGDGYVAGEGVGAVLLKPLHKAVQDGDHIYGVIKGSAVNAGGKTSGYTVPNPNAQTSVILDTLEKSHVNPRTISYVEAHGTGTSLGDPIEVTGLTKAFGKYTKDTNFCALGSVKSNIGHLESAAGIASVAKVLLQMKYKMLVPSIHSEPSNQNLNFKGTPFYVQKELKDWTTNEPYEVRRAGISSFGAGGANVHVIMEEYKDACIVSEEEKEQIFIFSAKNKDRLQEKVEQFLQFLKGKQWSGSRYSATNIAYTLQIGREEMEERMGVIASSIDSLITILEHVVNGEVNTDPVFYGNVRQSEQLGLDLLGTEEEDREFIQSIIRKNNLERICNLWVMGNHIDWKDFYGSNVPYKVSLPGYPFERESYWIEAEEEESVSSVLHPLIDKNISTLHEQAYMKTLSVKEFFLRDHVVSNQILLPGVAYIELARAAAELAGEDKVFALEDIEWLRPVIMTEDTKDLYISFTVDEGELYYNVFTKEEEGRVLHSRGRIQYRDDTSIGQAQEYYDVEAIRERCTIRKDKKYCYDVVFRALGFDYGPSFQVTNEVASGYGETIASLSLGEEYRKDLKKFVLHPALLDGAVRAVAVGNQNELVTESYIPFSLGRIEIYEEIPGDCYVYTKVKEHMDRDHKGMNVFDIMILDVEGKEIVRLIDFAVRPFQDKKKKSEVEEIYFYQENYVESTLNSEKQLKGKTVLVLGDNETIRTQLKQQWKADGLADNVIVLKKGTTFQKQRNQTYTIRAEAEEDYDAFIHEMMRQGNQITHILHMWDGGETTQEVMTYGIFSVMKLFKSITKLLPESKISCLRFLPNVVEIQPEEQLIPAFARSIVTVNHNFTLRSLQGDWSTLTEELFTQPNKKENCIIWKDGKRYVRRIENIDTGSHQFEGIQIHTNGTYLITGGCGALGKIMASYLVEQYQATVIMTGRKKMNREIQKFIDSLEALGGKGLYYSVDLANKEELELVMQICNKNHTPIQGVFHCAGIGGEKTILEADWNEVMKICQPKIQGVTYLDECTKNYNLDFMILYSSISAEIGDLGVGSYAIANSYLNYFAEKRNLLVKNGQRKGTTISINWPLWIDGGFGIPKEEESFYFDYLGLKLMNKESGLEAFKRIVQHPLSSVIVAAGDKQKIEKALKVEEKNQIVELLKKLKSGDITEAQAKQFIGGIL